MGIDDSERWSSYLHSLCFYPLAISPAPVQDFLFDSLDFFFFFISVIALRLPCDLSISITVEKSFS